MTAAQKHRDAVMRRDRVCQAQALGIIHACEGPLQSAHVPPKAWVLTARSRAEIRAHNETLPPELAALVTLSTDDLIADGDLGVALCAASHHAFDYLGRRGPREKLPEHVTRRCAELGLTPLLDRMYEPVRGARAA